MFKFQLRNFLKYDFSLVDRDDKGKVLFETRVEFYGGDTTPDFKGGTFHTENERVANLLRKHPWFDVEFFEIETPYSKQAAKKSTQPVKETLPALVEEVEEIAGTGSIESLEESNKEVTVFADITTVQEAARKVREIDPTVKTAEVRTINQINAVSERLGISFPNL